MVIGRSPIASSALVAMVTAAGACAETPAEFHYEGETCWPRTSGWMSQTPAIELDDRQYMTCEWERPCRDGDDARCAFVCACPPSRYRVTSPPPAPPPRLAKDAACERPTASTPDRCDVGLRCTLRGAKWVCTEIPDAAPPITDAGAAGD